MYKNHKLTIIFLAVIALVLGATDYLSYYFPVAGNIVTVLFLLLALVLIFYWYWLDTYYNNYKRSVLLNIAVIVLTWIAIPYYLYKSRAKEKRLKALIIFVLIFVGWDAMYYAGFYLLWGIERI